MSCDFVYKITSKIVNLHLDWTVHDIFWIKRLSNIKLINVCANFTRFLIRSGIFFLAKKTWQNCKGRGEFACALPKLFLKFWKGHGEKPSFKVQMTGNPRWRSRRPRYKSVVYLPNFDTLVSAPELSLADAKNNPCRNMTIHLYRERQLWSGNQSVEIRYVNGSFIAGTSASSPGVPRQVLGAQYFRAFS